MNSHQALWREQAQSDFEIYQLLRGNGHADCHQLHYLQMSTEKLAKAYFWRAGSAPSRTHAGLVQFLRSLGGTLQSQRSVLTNTFKFQNFNALQSWIRSILPIASDLERLAPALANDGPNPEYPWPHAAPSECPARYQFALANTLKSPGLGRQFIRFVEVAIVQLPAYA